MSRARGGGCSREAEVMPELLEIPEDDIPLDLQPRFNALKQLIDDHARSMSSGTSVSHAIKERIIGIILSDEVKQGARDILGPMFAIPDAQHLDADENGRTQLIDCILNSLITENVSVIQCINMTGKLLLKAFYKNNVFRVAVAASFVGSVGYVGWISGLGTLCGLGLGGCQVVFSALAACHHLIDNPREFIRQFEAILGPESQASVAGFINSLKEAVGDSVLFAGLVAQGNVALWERMYRPAAAAAASARPLPPSHLENLRDAIQGQLQRLPNGVEREAMERALLVIETAINNPPEGAAAVAPGAAVAVAPGAAPAPATLYRVMLDHLVNSAGVCGNYGKRYILSLFRNLGRVNRVFPGRVGPPGTDFVSYYCNVIDNGIISVYGIISAQFAHAGIAEHETLLATLFESILSSKLRRMISKGDNFSASQELRYLAFSLKDSIIDCLIRHGFEPLNAKQLLERCSLFASTVTEANVAAFIADMPDAIVREILLPRGPDGPSSQEVVASDSMPLDARFAFVADDLSEAARRNGIFMTAEELQQEGHKSVATQLLNAQPFATAANMAVAIKCKLFSFGAEAAPLFEQPAMPVELSAAHLKFLPLENLFTGMCMRLFQRITDFIDSHEEDEPDITNDTIRDHIYKLLQREFGYTDLDGFQKVIDTALIGFKIGTLWNNIRCTFTPAIVYKNGRPLAVYLIDIESTTVEVSGSQQIIFKHKIPVSFLKSGGVLVSRETVETAQELKRSVVAPAAGVASTVADAAYSLVDFCTKRTNVLVGALRRMVSCEVVPPADVAILQQAGQAAVASYARNVNSLVVAPGPSSGSSADAAENHLARSLDAGQLELLNQMCESLTGAIPPEIQLEPICRDINDEIRVVEGPMEEGGMSAVEVSERDVQPLTEVVQAADVGDITDETAEAAAAAAAEARADARADAEARAALRDQSRTLRDQSRSPPRPSSVTDTPPLALTKRQQRQQRQESEGEPDKKGGSRTRTRRRRSTSSARSSTTRGRKATSRRNQSKKHKQSSRRRRTSRRASRKN